MPKGIDFLQVQKGAELKKEKFFRFLKVSSIVFLIFYCLLVGAIFSFWVYFRKESQDINYQLARKKQRIQELQKVESLQIILKQRVFSLNKLFSEKRANYPELLSYLGEISASTISLEELEVSEVGEVTVKGSAPNAFAFSSFLEKLTSTPPPSPFSKIVLISASREEEGGYNFSFSCQTNGES